MAWKGGNKHDFSIDSDDPTLLAVLGMELSDLYILDHCSATGAIPSRLLRINEGGEQTTFVH